MGFTFAPILITLSRMSFSHHIPVTLYIHVPWCVRKCHYCDFNSHQKTADYPEEKYVARLLAEFKHKLPLLNNREICSIFIGGGTPSLFSPRSYQKLFEALFGLANFKSDLEITLEANPGTVEQENFFGYRELGINRLSIGVQSFQADKLKALGRIHSAAEASHAVTIARKAGFTNINLDLMFGLPKQSLSDGLFDLQSAIDLNPTHLSWYQLTLEPNTYFYKHPPQLPKDENIWELQQQGQELLKNFGYQQYEISAYAKNNLHCVHNLNYWEFGDYLGIGAGAHSKLSGIFAENILRQENIKAPALYMNEQRNFIAAEHCVTKDELALEFFMNTLRLFKPIEFSLMQERAGLTPEDIKNFIAEAVAQEFMLVHADNLELTQKGHLFLNDVLEILTR